MPPDLYVPRKCHCIVLPHLKDKVHLKHREPGSLQLGFPTFWKGIGSEVSVSRMSKYKQPDFGQLSNYGVYQGTGNYLGMSENLIYTVGYKGHWKDWKSNREKME